MFLGGWRGGGRGWLCPKLLDTNMTFVRPKRQKTPIPAHELCGNICYCSWPPSWPLLRPWSQSPSEHCKPCAAMHEGFSVSGAPFWDLVSQTPRPKGRGRPLFQQVFGFGNFLLFAMKRPSKLLLFLTFRRYFQGSYFKPQMAY